MAQSKKTISEILEDIETATKDGKGYSGSASAAANAEESPESALDSVNGCFDDIESYVSDIRDKLEEIQRMI